MFHFCDQLEGPLCPRQLLQVGFRISCSSNELSRLYSTNISLFILQLSRRGTQCLTGLYDPHQPFLTKYFDLLLLCYVIYEKQ